MATNDLSEKLLTYIPETHRGDPSYEDYIKAIGTMLDDIRVAIDDVKYYSDYRNMSERNLEWYARGLGLEFPRNLDEKTRRLLAKDIVNIHRSIGTEKSFEYMFRIIGLDIKFEYVWVLNPDPDAASINYAFGNEETIASGTYANVIDQVNNEYDRVEIIGENYPIAKRKTADKVMKTPYIRLTILEEDYNAFTEDYVGEDGETYSYTESERFQITQEILSYFIERGRPANVSILEISTPFELDDVVQFWPDNNSESFDIIQEGKQWSLDGTVTLDIAMDRYILGETQGNFSFDDSNMDVIASPAVETVERFYSENRNGKGLQMYIPLRKNTSVTFDRLTDGGGNPLYEGKVQFYKSVNQRRDIAEGNYNLTFITAAESTDNTKTFDVDNAFALFINIPDTGNYTTSDQDGFKVTVTQE